MGSLYVMMHYVSAEEMHIQCAVKHNVGMPS